MTTFDRIKTILMEHLGVDADQVTPTAKLLDDLGADSLDVVELAMALEDEFGIEIDDDEVAEKIRTVDEMEKMVEKLVSERKVEPQ